MGVADVEGTKFLTEYAGNKGGADIVIDMDTIYWSNGWGEIWKVPKSGGEPVSLAMNQLYPFSIQVDSTHVYWSQWSLTNEASVARVSRFGGTVQELHADPDGYRYTGLVVDPQHIYWISWGDSSIWRASKNGIGAKSFVSDIDAAWDHCVAIDSDYIYWAHKTVWRVPISGGVPVPVAELLYGCRSLALENGELYIVDEYDPTPNTPTRILRLEPLSGNLEVLGLETANVTCVAASASRVYWMTYSQEADLGTIVAIER